MKIILGILGLIVITFVVIQVYAMKSQKGIETYPYTVKQKYQDFEIRDYEASLFTSVNLTTGNYKESSSKGFSILAGYIFGGNDKGEKIAMTSPVAMSLEDSMTMMFMVPKRKTMKTLPTPNDSQVQFVEAPPKTVAALSFGGWADDEKIDKYKTKLTQALNKEGFKYSDRFYFLGYNAPYEIFNRKNEVIVELNNPEL